VLLAVLTYRRPADLREVLPLLLAQTHRVDASTEVLVVDNDPDASARDLVRGLADPGAVRYVHEPAPGIAAARNRALAEAAGFDLLVFIDDDERPVEDWLVLLLATYTIDRPTAVVGPVVSRYEGDLDPWIRAGRFFERRRLATGTVVDVAATNNLLLDLAQVRALGVEFDERFGLSGGSDTLFTRQVVARGGRMVWCDEAVVWDIVPTSRSTRQWVLRRAFRSGNGHSRDALDGVRSPVGRLRVRARLTAQGAVRFGGGSVRCVAGALTGSLGGRVRGLRTAARGAGMLSGAYGYVYSEYKRTPPVPAK